MSASIKTIKQLKLVIRCRSYIFHLYTLTNIEEALKTCRGINKSYKYYFVMHVVLWWHVTVRYISHYLHCTYVTCLFCVFYMSVMSTAAIWQTDAESESAWSKGSDEILWVFDYTDPWKHSSFSAFAYRPTLMGSRCTFKSLKRLSTSNVKLLHQVKECKLVKHHCWSLRKHESDLFPFFSNWLWPA